MGLLDARIGASSSQQVGQRNKMRNPVQLLRQLVSVSYLHLVSYAILNCNVAAGGGGSSGGDLWPLDRPDGMPAIQSLEVMCGKDHMDVHLTFSQPFEGIVSSKGQHGDPRCVYVPPSTGQTFFSFRIAYARCGTKPDLHGQFYENTVVVQYDKDLLEVWDEAKRLRCEWFNDYEKTASKPPMVIADLDVIQLDFRGDNVDCWMEIQHGKGPWAPPVSGIVPLGSTLTLVVAINDYRGEFDMRVKSCVASDGGGHVIQLSDEFGCVLRPKMISRFLKARGADERASVITYAFFHAFKFPDALSVHIKCKVEICRHGCLDHCQTPDKPGDISVDELSHYLGGPVKRKDVNLEDEEGRLRPDPLVTNEEDDGQIYDDIIHRPEQDVDSVGDEVNLKEDEDGSSTSTKSGEDNNNKSELDLTALPLKDILEMTHDAFMGPHRPKTQEPLVASPRSMSQDPFNLTKDPSTSSSQPLQTKRRKRAMVVSDRKARSTDVGVSGLYEVISEADLAFSPDNRAEAVTVFQGRIREEVVYGICMPVPGFSVLFVLVAVSAVVSALVAGTLLYRYQLQKEHLVQQAAQNSGLQMGFLNSFWGLRCKRPVQRAQPSSSSNGGLEGALTNGKSDAKRLRE